MERDIKVRVGGEELIFRPRKNSRNSITIDPGTENEETIHGFFLKTN